MKTVETNVYTFSELSEAAQRVALLRWQNKAGEYWESSEYVRESQEELEALGLESPAVNFSGFWSQGDGARFLSRRWDLETLFSFLVEGSPDFPAFATFVRDTVSEELLEALRRLAEFDGLQFAAVSVVERRWGNYVHENTARVECEGESGRELVDRFLDGLAGDLEALRLALSQRLYRGLEDCYDADTSEEYGRECLEADGDECFTVDGGLF